MCSSPYVVKGKKAGSQSNGTYSVPCGRCGECKLKRVKDWTFRLQQEERYSKSSYFVTLTYSPEHVPVSKNGFMTLSPKTYLSKPIKVKEYEKRTKISWVINDDLTKFMYRLRNYQKRAKSKPNDFPRIKYYACGEYGEEKQRPHYHLILFNVWDVSHVAKAWQKGKIDVEDKPRSGSFAYTASYISKDARIPMFKGDDRVKEFSRMSKGLGASYLTPQIKRYHRSDLLNRGYVSNPTNKALKQRMPRYYKDKIYTKFERIILAKNAQMEKWIREHNYDLENSDNSSIFAMYHSRAQHFDALLNKKNSKKRDYD